MADLEKRQKAGSEVERRMIEILMGWEPVQELRVQDIKYIALLARNIAFDTFSEAEA